MTSTKGLLRWTELDRTTFPEFRDQILQSEQEETTCENRSYPGYPRWLLERVRARTWTSLDRVLLRRRCVRVLDTALPSRKTLSRLLGFSHGIHATMNKGPIPSAGGLQALELYLVLFEPSWIPAGLYHYDRLGHHLSQISSEADRSGWQQRVPSMNQVVGGALLWVLVGEGERVQAKYGGRGLRFLLLEAGHLMQNFCLLSASLGYSTVPLGGYFEREVASQLHLPATDWILYVGLCGQVLKG